MATENMTNRKPTKCEMFTEILNILNETEARQKKRSSDGGNPQGTGSQRQTYEHFPADG